MNPYIDLGIIVVILLVIGNEVSGVKRKLGEMDEVLHNLHAVIVARLPESSSETPRGNIQADIGRLQDDIGHLEANLRSDLSDIKDEVVRVRDEIADAQDED